MAVEVNDFMFIILISAILQYGYQRAIFKFVQT